MWGSAGWLFAAVLGAAQGTPESEPEPKPQQPPPPKQEERGRTELRPIEPQESTGSPGRVVVVEKEALGTEAALTHDAGRVLSRVVPSAGPSTESLSNGGQTIRGGVITVMIDGVPQSTPLRNSQRDLKILDLSSVEGIEVRHLPTGSYGYGASGSVINYVTRSPGRGEPQLSSEASLGMSLTHPDDSVRGRVAQSISGRSGSIGYVAAASAEVVGGLFDWDGDRIPPDPHLQGGVADTLASNLFGKLEWEVGPGRAWELMVDRYVIEQDTDYAGVPGVAGETKTSVAEADLPGKKPGTRNAVARLGYSSEAEGRRVEASLFYQAYLTRFPFRPAPLFPGGGQSFIESVKWGFLGSVDLPVPQLSGRLELGAGFVNDRTAQPLEDGRDYAPPMEADHADLFAQWLVPMSSRTLVRAGVRFEWTRLDVETFDTLFVGNTVQGGILRFRDLLPNAGFEWKASEGVRLFMGYARTFNIADIGRDLQSTSAASVDDLGFEGQLTDNFEAGVAASLDRIEASFTLFYGTSDEGITFGNLPALAIRRRSEYVYGAEAAVTFRPSEALRLDLSVASMEGRYDSDGDGTIDEYLPGYRIPPLQVVASVESSTVRGWRNRLQLQVSGRRDRFPGSPNFGEGAADAYAIVSLLSSVDVAGGTFSLGVDNLLDEEYFPVASSTSNSGFVYTAGEGAVARASFRIEW